MIERVGEDPVHGRNLYVGRIARLEDWPATLDEPAPHFVAMLAVDASGVPDQTILDFAGKLLDQGAAYTCAWGPGCERVHDLIDAARGEGVPDEGDEVVMTSWHADDSLDEALWFALYAACPSDRFIETCGSVVAVVAGPDEWERQIRARFSEPRGLIDDVGR